MKLLLSSLTLALLGITSFGQAPAPAAPKLISPEDAKPAPLVEPAPKAAEPKKAKAPTIIIADHTDFEMDKGITVYSGHVKVTSPDFDLTTDGTLEIRQKTEKPKPAAAPVNPVNPVSEVKAPQAEEESGGIEFAEAKGGLVHVEKTGLDGKIKAADCEHMIFKGDTKDVILKGWPQLSDGPTRLIATDAATIMTLDKNNKLKVDGLAKTVLAPEKDPNKKKK